MKFICLKFAALFLLAASCGAQTLAPNYHIKTAGQAYHRLALDKDGNTYVYGTFDHLNGQSVGRLLKLDPSGNPMEGFKRLDANDAIIELLVLPDNKVLISGYFTQINGKAVSQIVRLNSDGTIDETFSCSLGQGSMRLQSTGKIIVHSNSVFYRLNPNGSIDQTFKFQNFAYSYAPFRIGPDNSIYYSISNKVYKLTADGIDDPSFQPQPDATQREISAFEIQQDGKILAGSTGDGTSASVGLFRLNSNGTLDTSFKPGKIYGQVFQIIIRANGKILIGGQFTGYDTQSASLVELNTDGTLSRIVAVVMSNWITTILEGQDTKITIGGEFSFVNNLPAYGIWRFNTNYTKDESFAPTITLTPAWGTQILVNDDLHATLIGAYNSYGIFNGNDLLKSPIHQIDALGANNPKFKFATTGYTSITASESGSNGKMYLSGTLGQGLWELIRINKDGSRDASFNIGTGATLNGMTQLLQLVKKIDNRIFVSGDFTHFNGIPSGKLVALTEDGAVAQAYTSLPTTAYIYSIAKQSDGKLILLGGFTIAGQTKNLIRLNADGTIDQTFHQIYLNGSANSIEVDKDDKIYLAGGRLTIDGALLYSLVRLTPDGFIDDTFNVGAGFRSSGNNDGYVYKIVLLPEDKIAAAGYFESVQGSHQPGLAFLDKNGNVIPQSAALFGNGSQPTQLIYKSGKLFIAGRLKTADNTETYGLAKVLLENVTAPVAPSNLAATLTSPGKVTVNWAASADNLAFVVERAVNSLENFVAADTIAGNVPIFTDLISPNDFHTYRVRAVNDAGISPYSNIDSLLWIPKPEGTITLTANYSEASKTSLSWSDNIQYHEGYKVERSDQPDAGFMQIGAVGTTVKTFSDNSDEIKTRYYRVIAYNKKGLVASNKVTLLVTGIESESGAQIGVHPNPADNHIVITIPELRGTAQLAIIDGSGKTVKENTLPTQGIHTIEVADLPPGLYLVKVLGKQMQWTRKIVKK